MYPRKRLRDLLHAAAVLRTRIPDVQIRIVGQGPDYPRLVRLHGELGLGESVILLGDVSRERLAAEYVGADVFCLPSVQEGFGIVFLEAMAAGLAVVACRAAAVPTSCETARPLCWCRRVIPKARRRARRFAEIRGGLMPSGMRAAPCYLAHVGSVGRAIPAA